MQSMAQVPVSEDYCDIRRFDTLQIERLLQSGKLENCGEVLDSYLDQVQFRNLESLMLRLYVGMDIYIVAKSFTDKLGIPKAKFISRFGTIDEIAAHLQTVDETISFLNDMIEQCILWRIAIASENSNPIVQNAKDYIDQNYMRDDLSLTSVADAVGLSPTYLSALFKREMNRNFSDYLTQLRIHKSKELLCCTSKLIYEVAYEVGFRDYRYFSQIFKKYTGQTPRQFQSSANVSL